MPRIRTIKPEMLLDEALGTRSIHARLLFVGLITQADDDGRLRGAPALIGSQVFPYDGFPPAKVDAWLTELAATELITRYEHGGQKYIALTSWSRHQRINRKTDSTLPPPPSEEPVHTTRGVLIEDAVRTHGDPAEASHPEVEVEVEVEREKEEEHCSGGAMSESREDEPQPRQIPTGFLKRIDGGRGAA